MKDIKQYIIENKDFQQSFNESQDTYFSEQEKGKIMKDMWNKNGIFYKFVRRIIHTCSSVPLFISSFISSITFSRY
jgi:hypothetical protein